MSETTDTDYMKSVRFTAGKLAAEIAPDTEDRAAVEEALLVFAGSILDVARHEAARDSARHA